MRRELITKLGIDEYTTKLLYSLYACGEVVTKFNKDRQNKNKKMEQRDVNINGENLHHLRFSDIIGIIRHVHLSQEGKAMSLKAKVKFSCK